MILSENLLEEELNQLEQEHKDLNEIMDDPTLSSRIDQTTMARLKKRKLLTKDKITYIKRMLYPDIIA
jgi:hypothetical protein